MNKKNIVAALVCILASTSAMAELPDQSILSRYGIASDQLPTGQADETVDASSGKSHFKVPLIGPWGVVVPSDAMKPPMTGNISIDQSVQQDQERCRRMQNEALRRNGGWGGWAGCPSISIEPQITTGFTR
ncbi:hypothetical protein [Pseudomonas brassicacearum]|uniref:hypothetical protein n=1 Tax=Pseudomonas brassicacearum TaxID=930166 RepID=UPI0015E71A9D|nr:hypothetical protein [Pseudomonas brassicacearum]